jgi:hypothetical protein
LKYQKYFDCHPSLAHARQLPDHHPSAPPHPVARRRRCESEAVSGRKNEVVVRTGCRFVFVRTTGDGAAYRHRLLPTQALPIMTVNCSPNQDAKLGFTVHNGWWQLGSGNRRPGPELISRPQVFALCAEAMFFQGKFLPWLRRAGIVVVLARGHRRGLGPADAPAARRWWKTSGTRRMHFTAYFGLALLATLAWGRRRGLIWILLGLITMGAVMEVLQGLVGRDTDWLRREWPICWAR